MADFFCNHNHCFDTVKLQNVKQPQIFAMRKANKVFKVYF